MQKYDSILNGKHAASLCNNQCSTEVQFCFYFCLRVIREDLSVAQNQVTSQNYILLLGIDHSWDH